MKMMPLVLAGYVDSLVMMAMIAVCVLLILIVLVQRGRGGGLAGAFGGAGGSSSAFGAKTGDVFTKITIGFAALFMLLSVLGNYALTPSTPAPTVVGPLTPTGAPGPVTSPEGEGEALNP